MTTNTIALAQSLGDFEIDEVFILMAHEDASAARYVDDLYADEHPDGLDELDELLYPGSIGEHLPITWACLADLAQWGQFWRGEYTTREIYFTVLRHEASAAPALEFDY